MPTILPFDAFDLGEAEVRGRFEWAVRRGHPHWLWPDTPVEAWQATLTQFEAAARQILTTGQAQDRLCGRPADVAVAGYTSGMGPLLGHWLGEGRLEADDEVAAVLDMHLRHNARRMELMARRARAIVEALARHGVAVLVLKGMHTAFRYFAVPGARPLSDIDLAIRPADRQRAAKALAGMGLAAGAYSPNLPPQQSWRAPDAPGAPRSLSLTHADDPWSVDLQMSLNRRCSSGSPTLRLDRLWAACASEQWALSPEARALTLEAQALHLACHASCGFANLSMIRLCELVFVGRWRGAEGGLDWDEFVRLARETDALPAAYPALHLTEQLAPGTVPGQVLEAGRKEAPAAVLAVLRGLSPARAQRVLRGSIQERFMWSRSAWQVARAIVRDVLVPTTSPGMLLSIQKERLLRLLGGRITWQSQGCS